MKADQSIGEMKNLGPKMAAWLAEAQIYTRGDLERIGAVMAYKILQHHHPKVSILALYSMYAALEDRHWNSLSLEEKARLKAEADDTLDVG
ncbi:MAG: hypothetical protein RhofKO_39330 [Rhodothermales bacterium]